MNTRLQGKSFFLAALATLLGTFTVLQGAVVMASNSANFSQTINDGVKAVDIVDGSGNTVASPAVGFGGLTFSFNSQTGTGALGSAGERIRVYNPTSGATWTVSMAATSGATSLWDSGSSTYDYNDSNTDGSDDGDTDAKGGKLTVDPSAGTLAAVSPCASTSNISKGSSSAFKETAPAVNSISLLTAASGAPTYCRWDLTGVGLSQVLPAAQASGTYNLNFTITIA